MFRARILCAAAGLFILFAVVSAITPDWIEALSGWDPDHHSGVLEFGIVAALAIVALMSAILGARGLRQVRQPA